MTKLSIGEQMLLVMKRKNMSYTDLGKILDISPQAVSQQFKKDCNSMTIKNMKRFANALGCELEITLKEAGE